MTDASGCEEKALVDTNGEVDDVKDTEQVSPSMSDMPMYQGPKCNVAA